MSFMLLMSPSGAAGVGVCVCEMEKHDAPSTVLHAKALSILFTIAQKA